MVVEHSPTLLEIAGLGDDTLCGAITFEHPATHESFYRARSTDRWVLFKRSVKGHGEPLPLHRNQR